MSIIKQKNLGISIQYDDENNSITTTRNGTPVHYSDCFVVLKLFMSKHGLENVGIKNDYKDKSYTLNINESIETFEKRTCMEDFNKQRKDYESRNANVPLDSFLSLDYSVGYPNLYPITDPIAQVLGVKDNFNGVRTTALRARYANPSYPKINPEKERDFNVFYHYGSKFLLESGGDKWMQNYAQISNFVDEVVDNNILFDGNSFVIDPKASKEQIIMSALPQVVSTFLMPYSTKETENDAAPVVSDAKNYVNWLANFSTHSEEFASLQDKLQYDDYKMMVLSANKPQETTPIIETK